MQKVLNLVLINTLLLLVSVNAQPTELTELKKVQIPEEIFLGGLLQIDMDDDRILITDNSIGQVVLFKGSEWKVLDPEDCHPGFWFQPIQAKFGDNDEIFITNSGIWGFRFKKNGECVGAVEKGSRFFTAENFYYGNDIVGINADFAQKHINLWDKKGKEMETLFSVTNEFPNAEYRIQGGGIFEADNTVYFAKVLEPIIYSFNRETKELNSHEFNSDLFKPITADISNDIKDPKFLKEVGRVFKNNSVIQSLYHLNQTTGILFFSQNVGEGTSYYGLIFDLKDLKIKETLILKSLPVFVENNEFVFIERESEGYETEIVELVFKTRKKK
tara:strand:+ start:7403 stop:8392 length:990 start_codon:yes stop_codon:yes gene_type:complete